MLSPSETRQGCLLSPVLFNIVLEVPTRAIKEEDEIKDIQIGKEEVKFSLFVDDIILYIKIPKDSTKKIMRINNFSNLQGTRLVYKNKLYFYTLAINNPKIKLRK